MLLTKRDLDIFKLISKTTILTTAQIHREIFPGVATTTVLRRLRKLERQKFIDRIEGLPNHELAWALAPKGAGAIGCADFKRRFHRLALVHDVKLAGLRLALEGHGIARSWIPEHEIRFAMARKHGVKRMKSQSVPDGIMGVSYKGVMESVAIELELHYKNKDRYRDTFQSYQWKKNIKAVWYLVPSESLGRHMERLWRKYVGQVGPWLLWSLVDDVLANPGIAATHYFDKSFELGCLFEPRAPAHTGGSGVSRESDAISAAPSLLNTENESKILTPAS